MSSSECRARAVQLGILQQLQDEQLRDALARRSASDGDYDWKAVAGEVVAVSQSESRRSECRTRAAQLRLWTPPSDRYTPGGRPLVSISQVVYIYDPKDLARSGGPAAEHAVWRAHHQRSQERVWTKVGSRGKWLYRTVGGFEGQPV